MFSPICLWMTSRSRSSMIAGVFAAHGVYWGDQQQQSAGYDTYEYQAVKKLLKRYYGLPFKTMVNIDQNFESELRALVPNNKTWMYKGGIEYYNAFRIWCPFNVFILRDPAAVAKSICQKRQNADYDVALEAAKWRLAAMKGTQAQDGGVFIDTDRVVSGDLAQLREAVEFCGVVWDEGLAKGVIK